MFEVGFTELLVIFALALVVLGPERLPRLASQVGRWIGRARAMARQFRDQLEAEATIEDPFAPSSPPPQAPPRPAPAPPEAAATTPTVETQAAETAREPSHERGQ
jgi:Tat protein translocase TatB subunit